VAQAGHPATRPYRVKALVLTIALFAVTVSLFAAASATAELAGNYAKFAQCPYNSPEAAKCLYSMTSGGEVVLGSTKVPIVNPAILQGAYTEPGKSGVSRFIDAANGISLSKASQPIPGGLLGIVAPADASPLVKAVIALFFENDLTKASASLQLARPAEEIRFNEENFGGEAGPGLALPIKVHLENPLLGPSCYVGSSFSPILWALTSGTTAPPKPNKPITGTVGEVEFKDGGGLAETKRTTLVDNAWSAPLANGCGGPLSSLINPIVNGSAGLPAVAGVNEARLDNAVAITSASTVREKAIAGS
jgi:hypothetical protein